MILQLTKPGHERDDVELSPRDPVLLEEGWIAVALPVANLMAAQRDHNAVDSAPELNNSDRLEVLKHIKWKQTSRQYLMKLRLLQHWLHHQVWLV